MPGSKAGKKKSSGAAGNGDRFTESARARGLSTISKAKAERSIAYAKRSAKRLETLRRKSALEEVAGLRGGGGPPSLHPLSLPFTRYSPHPLAYRVAVNL